MRKWKQKAFCSNGRAAHSEKIRQTTCSNRKHAYKGDGRTATVVLECLERKGGWNPYKTTMSEIHQALPERHHLRLSSSRPKSKEKKRAREAQRREAANKAAPPQARTLC